jgi:anti-anti-sigma factor
MELRLIDFPLDLFERSVQHTAALQRELDVIRVDERDPDRLPDRLAQLVNELDLRFVGYRAAMDTIDALVRTQARYHDVVIPVAGVPAEAALAVEQLRDLMDEVDRYCAQDGGLLTPPTPPEVLAFRRWLFDQVIGQLRGQSPTAWTLVAASLTAAAREQAAAAAVPSADTSPDDAGGMLRPSGDVDLNSAGRLREEIYSAHADRDDDLTIDLTRVDFIDSVGLSVLVAAHKRFERDHRRLEIQVPEHLRANFEMTGLTGVLNIV